MEEENITSDGYSGASQLNAADPIEAVGSVAEAQALSLAELNSLTGKNFPTKESALKSIKDTFSYVGRKNEDIEKEVAAKFSNNEQVGKLASELAEMRKEQFYDKNSQYAPYRKVIERMGGNPTDVVNSEEFKDIFTKASGYDESQKLKTVLESNPRLSSSRDSLSKARDIITANGSAPLQGVAREEVESLAARAVLDAYGLK